MTAHYCTAMKKAAFLVLSFLFIAADQISKWAVTERLLRPLTDGITAPLDFIGWYKTPPAPLGFAKMEVLPFFNIAMVWNKGISFGMFNQDASYAAIILVGISVLISLIFLIMLLRSPVSLQSLGIAMIIGGAMGNVIDRLRFGAVIDFLDFHIGDWHWPSFNVADSCICVGVGVLIVMSLLFPPNPAVRT